MYNFDDAQPAFESQSEEPQYQVQGAQICARESKVQDTQGFCQS
jgi:hypothetical protein